MQGLKFKVTTDLVARKLRLLLHDLQEPTQMLARNLNLGASIEYFAEQSEFALSGAIIRQYIEHLQHVVLEDDSFSGTIDAMIDVRLQLLDQLVGPTLQYNLGMM